MIMRLLLSTDHCKYTTHSYVYWFIFYFLLWVLIWFDLFRFPYIQYMVKDHMDVEIVKITIKKKYIE
jgi:hypothetical protein